MLPGDMARSNPLLWSALLPLHPPKSKNLDVPSFPSSTNLLYTTLLWPAPVRCQKAPQGHKPATPGRKGLRALLFATAATSWMACLWLCSCRARPAQTWLLELPGTSNASRQVPLFVIYTIVPRTPSVTLNPLSDVIEIF